MAAITSLHAAPADGRIARTVARLTALAKRAKALAAPMLERHRSPAMTFAGLASIDASAWQVAHAFGWLAIGASILVYDAFGRDKPPAKPGDKP